MYEFDDSTDFDAAPSSAGPWLRFYAKTSQDGTIPPGAWALRDNGTNTVINLSRGVVIDWRAVRTGWVQATGVEGGPPPVKQWNPSRAKFLPRPPGDKWAKGFMAPLAYAPDAAALWEQWGAGAWMGFAEMFAALMTIAPQQLPNLPLLMLGNPVPQKFAQGPSLKPVLTISRFVPAPACLTEFISQLPSPSPQPAHAISVTTQTTPAVAARPPAANWDSTPATQALPARAAPAVKPDVEPSASWDRNEDANANATPAPTDLVDDEIPW